MPIVIIPGFSVTMWLSPLLDVPYFFLVFSVSTGQIVPATLGILLIDMANFLNREEFIFRK